MGIDIPKRPLIAILLLAFSGSLFAESYLCIGEKGAGVNFGNGITISSTEYDMSNQKYILSNRTGEWRLYRFGSEVSVFRECIESTTVMTCRVPNDPDVGFFTRHDYGTFRMLYYTGKNDDPEQGIVMTIMAGKCSKI
ncbi:MAG: hypothetical protein OER98_04560 [Gammaproteobacteria bacterium]|nr:hypothetical protein [Gammaproteobacteria bacterium]